MGKRDQGKAPKLHTTTETHEAPTSDLTAPARTGGDILVGVLREAGVHAAFGVVSIHNLPLVEAVDRDLRFVPMRHEAAAVNAADGYARASGVRPARRELGRARRQRPDESGECLVHGLFPALPGDRAPTHPHLPRLDLLEDCVKDLGGRAVLKPLQGSGGSGVFLVDRNEAPNLNQSSRPSRATAMSWPRSTYPKPRRARSASSS